MKKIIAFYIIFFFIANCGNLSRKNPADPNACNFQGPKVEIICPTTIIENISWLSLLGKAKDVNGKIITDLRAYEWHSDIDGYLGYGMSLYNFTIDPGKEGIYLTNWKTHIITLKVTDKNGYINYAKVKIVLAVKY
jgi:hypothetical protein